MAKGVKRRRGLNRSTRSNPKARPAWVPDALVIIKVKDGSAGERLRAALQSAIDAFADPVIVRVVTMNEDVSTRELEDAGLILEAQESLDQVGADR